MPSHRDYVELAEQLDLIREERMRKAKARLTKDLATLDELTARPVIDYRAIDCMSESVPEPVAKPVPEPERPSFALPVSGLPIDGRTLPDSGPLGHRIVSTPASRANILKALRERVRFPRH